MANNLMTLKLFPLCKIQPDRWAGMKGHSNGNT